jgi:hypothetical protein
VPVEETVRGFKEILDGKHDDVPEGNFYMKGGIQEIQEGSEDKDKDEKAKDQKPKEEEKTGGAKAAQSAPSKAEKPKP